MTSIRGDDFEDVNEPVTWSDSSAGRPGPMPMCTGSLVDGCRIVVGVAGGDVACHGSTSRTPFRCDDPGPNGAIRTVRRPGGATASLPPLRSVSRGLR